VLIRAAHPSELEAIEEVDDDAAALYAEHGITIELAHDDPFCVAERTRWAASIAREAAFVAQEGGVIAGIAVCGLVDGEPYLDQLAVRVAFMRRGIGRALLERAISWAAPRALWLNTYDELSFNRPFYERAGFVVVPERAWGTEMAAIVAEQRAVLPAPDRRVVMRRDPR
jgi:GNAT superfamily N-acetyltransferase